MEFIQILFKLKVCCFHWEKITFDTKLLFFILKTSSLIAQCKLVDGIDTCNELCVRLSIYAFVIHEIIVLFSPYSSSIHILLFGVFASHENAHTIWERICYTPISRIERYVCVCLRFSVHIWQHLALFGLHAAC